MNMRLLTSLLIFSILLSCTIEKNKDIKEEEIIEEVKKETGINIYQSRCTSCHGFDGKMGFGGAKDLTETELSIEKIIYQVTNGKGAMAPYKNLLSKEEIDSVSVYVHNKIKK